MEKYFKRVLNGPPFEENEDKIFEFIRLMSFENWPSESPLFPIKLSKAGFYYTGDIDEVVCFSCGTKKNNWQFGDEPMNIHQQLNPQCKFINNEAYENIPIISEPNDSPTPCTERLNRIWEQLNSTDQLTVTEGACNFLSGTKGRRGKSTGANSVPKSGSTGALSKQSRNSPDNTCLSATRSLDTGIGTVSQGKLSGRNIERRHSSATSRGQADDLRARGAGSSRQNPASDSRPSMTTRKGNDIPPPTGDSIGPLRFERNRLETFRSWPSNACVPAAELAKSGFYYTGSGDRVQCIFCKGILRNWEEGDRPHIEHRKHFPRCPLVLGMRIGNVPLPLDTQNQASTSDERQQNRVINVGDSIVNMASLGIVTDRPKHPQYAIVSQRLASFQSWPPYKHQTPQMLAEAGFWYAGFSDNVKCFYCDGGLRNWEPGDEPWSEHARWFPKCPFVKQVKGDEFINTVQRDLQGDVPILAQVQRPQGQGESSSSQGRSSERRRVEEREIRARMDRDYVKVVEGMGIKKDNIKKALRKQLMETGDDFPSAQALLEAVFKIQDEGEMSSSEAEDEELEEEETSNNTERSEDAAAPPEAPTEPVAGPQNNDNNEVRSDETPAVNSSKEDDLVKENMELKEQRLCKICMVADANVVFLPCGHLVSCAACAPALQLCPICRAAIKGTIRTYLA